MSQPVIESITNGHARGHGNGPDTVTPAERARLVRLCARLTGDREAAEDLAQETLITAWRHAHKLRDPHDPEGRARWLAAIARNICLRWRRVRGRERGRLAPAGAIDATGAPLEERLADRFDLEVELERDELATLLDRALALLPADTRAVLIARLIEESPQAEVAARLGLSEGAVAMRLQRGKLALRRVLTGDLREEAAAYGLHAPDEGDGWRETRVWCPLCGRRRLIGRFAEGGAELSWYCPECSPEPGVVFDRVSFTELFDGVTGYKAAFSAFSRWLESYFRPGLARRSLPCVCGHTISLRTDLPENPPRIMRGRRGVYAGCDSCGATEYWQGLAGLVLALPAAQRFRRDHPRMRMLPEREVEVAGRAAVVTRLESVTDGARLDVISARDTYELLGVHGALGGE
ncbi:MAG: sigma-70 family RNA polymerase sigma factor [Chloroflexota bacterium]|nr:sigma-70 family RNA polymerase sigma factor [Chloroflexota bacterium]